MRSPRWLFLDSPLREPTKNRLAAPHSRLTRSALRLTLFWRNTEPNEQDCRFNEGRLNGLSVGGAWRHRAEPLLSYSSSIINNNEQLDLSKPLYGEDEDLFDLSLNYRGRTDVWGLESYRIGLNIRNVLDETDFITKPVNVSGQPIRLARVFGGRTFILSVDLGF